MSFTIYLCRFGESNRSVPVSCASITTLADYFDVKHRAADPDHAPPPPPPPRDPVDDDSPEDEARD